MDRKVDSKMDSKTDSKTDSNTDSKTAASSLRWFQTEASADETANESEELFMTLLTDKERRSRHCMWCTTMIVMLLFFASIVLPIVFGLSSLFRNREFRLFGGNELVYQCPLPVGLLDSVVVELPRGGCVSEALSFADIPAAGIQADPVPACIDSVDLRLPAGTHWKQNYRTLSVLDELRPILTVDLNYTWQLNGGGAGAFLGLFADEPMDGSEPSIWRVAAQPNETSASVRISVNTTNELWFMAWSEERSVRLQGTTRWYQSRRQNCSTDQVQTVTDVVLSTDSASLADHLWLVVSLLPVRSTLAQTCEALGQPVTVRLRPRTNALMAIWFIVCLIVALGISACAIWLNRQLKTMNPILRMHRERGVGT